MAAPVRADGFRLAACGALARCVAAVPGAAGAQDLAGPGAVHYTAGIELADVYMFRGVRQNSSGIVAWPFADIGVRTYTGEGAVKRVGLSAGFWNSLNTGDTGAGGPIGSPWYESRVSGEVGVRIAGGLSMAASYTAYLSPNALFSSAKELGLELTADDRVAISTVPIRPYALVAFEVDTDIAAGQLDGGQRAGTYLEAGASPRFGGRRLALDVPMKVGLSLRDYYELGPADHTFGFFSVAGIVSVPLGPRSSVGQLTLRGGAEFHALGETTKAFNHGDPTQLVAVVGVRLAR